MRPIRPAVKGVCIIYAGVLKNYWKDSPCYLGMFARTPRTHVRCGATYSRHFRQVSNCTVCTCYFPLLFEGELSLSTASCGLAAAFRLGNLENLTLLVGRSSGRLMSPCSWQMRETPDDIHLKVKGRESVCMSTTPSTPYLLPTYTARYLPT